MKRIPLDKARLMLGSEPGKRSARSVPLARVRLEMRRMRHPYGEHSRPGDRSPLKRAGAGGGAAGRAVRNLMA